VRERHKRRLAEKLSTVDARLSQSKGLALGVSKVLAAHRLSSSAGALRAPGAAAGGALTAAQVRIETLLRVKTPLQMSLKPY
jgi:hypothetical protein